MDLEDIGISAGNWVDSAQDRNYWRALENATLNLRVPKNHGVSQLIGEKVSNILYYNIYEIHILLHY